MHTRDVRIGKPSPIVSDACLTKCPSNFAFFRSKMKKAPFLCISSLAARASCAMIQHDMITASTSYLVPSRLTGLITSALLLLTVLMTLGDLLSGFGLPVVYRWFAMHFSFHSLQKNCFQLLNTIPIPIAIRSLLPFFELSQQALPSSSGEFKRKERAQSKSFSKSSTLVLSVPLSLQYEV